MQPCLEQRCQLLIETYSVLRNATQVLCSTLMGFFGLFGFVALRPKSTAMVIAGQSVHLTTLFPGQA